MKSNYKKAKPLKRSKTGIEIEMHLIDEKGEITNKALDFISTVKKENNKINIVKESGMNMVEFRCHPYVKTHSSLLDIINFVEKSYHIARKNNLYFFPFATYPGKFISQIVNFPTYKIKEKIFGLERYRYSPKAAGFHHHYALPKGIFDEKTGKIRLMKKSKLMRSMVSSYNFEIAADPALTLLAQSSSLCQGEYIAKDTRILYYRGGRKLKFPEGCFGKLQQFGGLPPYKVTSTDLLESVERRVIKWKQLVKNANPKADFDKLYPAKLDIGWNPIKINKLGTLEQRGMDMNFFSIIVPIAILLKFCLKKIQREFIEMIPSDFAVDDPFKLEGRILYIPPHTYVRNKLQFWSAYKGYNKKEAYEYTKKFFNFAKSITPKKYGKIIRPISEMIENKESVSDKILKYAKRKGYLNNGKIGKKDACELSLYYSKMFHKDLLQVKEHLNKIKTL